MKSKKPIGQKVTRRKEPFNLKVFLRKFIKYFLKVVKITAALAILVGLAYLFIYSGFFNVKNINIVGADKFVSSLDLREVASANIMDKNIFTLKKFELEKKLKDNFLGADAIELEKKIPRTIKVIVKERVPIAIVYKNEENQFLVDKEGYVLGYVSAENNELPRINYQKEISVGLFIDKNIVPVYQELTELLSAEDIKVSSVSFQPDYVSFYLDRGENVLIGLMKNKLEAVKALSALMKQAKVENKDIQKIDLRYDKVIVLFK